VKRTSPGRYVETSTAGETVRAFVPDPLPPVPPIEWKPELRERFDLALLALGRLDALASLLPNPGPLLYSFVRKEAVLSSAIEGTQSSLSDLMLYEVEQQPGVPLDDAREVSRYVSALEHGLSRLDGGFPLSLRLIREIHQVLLEDGRGSTKNPGQFRTSQVWIGGTRPGNAIFVPPPANTVIECMGHLEQFFHVPGSSVSPLLKAALTHVQFETIHPFLDGNGRVGRLLITLMLCEQGILSVPLLYVSLFFKKNRKVYYDLLCGVRVDGDWETWLEFFADAVRVAAEESVTSIRQFLALVEQDTQRIAELGRASSSVLTVFKALQRMPVTTGPDLTAKTGLVATTVNTSLGLLENLGVVEEVTGRRRNRVYSYRHYIEILNRDMELP